MRKKVKLRHNTYYFMFIFMLFFCWEALANNNFITEIAVFQVKEDHIGFLKSRIWQEKSFIQFDNMLKKSNSTIIVHQRGGSEDSDLIGGAEPLCCLGDCYDVTKKIIGEKIGIKKLKVKVKIISNTEVELTIDIDSISIDKGKSSTKRQIVKVVNYKQFVFIDLSDLAKKNDEELKLILMIVTS